MQPTISFPQAPYGQGAAEPQFNAGPQFPPQAPALRQGAAQPQFCAGPQFPPQAPALPQGAAQPQFSAGPQFPPQAPPRASQAYTDPPPFPPAPPLGATHPYSHSEPAPFQPLPPPPPPPRAAHAYNGAPRGADMPAARLAPFAAVQPGGPVGWPVPPGQAANTPVPQAQAAQAAATPTADSSPSVDDASLPPLQELQAGNWPVGRIVGARHTAWVPFHRQLDTLLHAGGSIDQAELAEVSRQHLKFSSIDGERWTSRRSYLGTKYYFLRTPWNRVYGVREDDSKSHNGKNALRELSKDLLNRGGEPAGWSWSTQGADRSRFTFDLI